MATSSEPAGLLDEGPPYRSWKELCDDETARVDFSPAAKRLFWPLDGVFPTALSVMKTPRSPDDLEPFFQQTLEGDIWHEIAQLPLTEPRVSSIEASVYDMDQWEFDWVAWHGWHEGEPADPEYVTYGDLSDDHRPYATEQKEDGSWEEDSDTEFLIRCCGEDRPLGKTGQKLVVRPAEGGHFITVHDYVSAVHPWLMGLRPEILLAKAVARPEPYPQSAEMAWMVDKGPKHEVTEKQSWLRAHGGGTPLPVPPGAAASLARIRAALRKR
ncbi:hypothetical protein CkaCkLH20_11684 [Colletotrichum karsti]|uniref:Uncharacterized protein n=1 Tax=Colletotrichum karsti TaxID=1095194 RepID=A0A9P6HVB9_9PEZI|nr:uncharacterized protein CkaCkLH20_11684 [Colletotrichum karsti]KAF9870785.1 hypothetical protein CkaCkLH20_11684 [Colletotrichum karsti]